MAKGFKRGAAMGSDNKYIPALSYEWLTLVFDPIIRFTMPELEFKQQLIREAKIESGYKILDVGCGTGTLLALIKKIHQDAEVRGLDGDKKVIELAKKKLSGLNLDIPIDLGYSYKLPYEDNSFDRVLSTLMIHHLTTEDKLRTFQEIYRVLRPGGEFHLADFGIPATTLTKLVSLIIRHFEEVADNFDGKVPPLIKNAGFNKVDETGKYNSLYGTVVLLKAIKPKQ